MIWKAVHRYNRIPRFDRDTLNDIYGDIVWDLSFRAKKYRARHKSKAKFSTYVRPRIYAAARTLFMAEMRRRSKGVKSMDAEWVSKSSGQRENNWYAVVRDESFASPYDQIERRDIRDVFRKAFKVLDPLERAIIDSYYFRGNMSDRKVQEVLNLEGEMTHGNVYLVRREAEEKLRKSLRFLGVADYLKAS